MELLTQQLNVVSSERKGTNSEPGHTMVVFELKDHAKHFVGICPSDRAFTPRRKPLFGAAPEYVSFIVKDIPVDDVFSDRYLHKSVGHSFDLSYTMRFQVADAQTVVAHMKSDPVMAVRSEIKRLVGEAVAIRDWENIVTSLSSDNCKTMLTSIIGQHWGALQAYANTYGIKLITLGAMLHLTAEDAAPIKHAAEKAREVEIKTIDIKTEINIQQLEEQKKLSALVQQDNFRQQEIILQQERMGQEHGIKMRTQLNDNEFNELKRIDLVRNEFVKAQITGMHNVASDIKDVNDLLRAADAVRTLSQGGGNGGVQQASLGYGALRALPEGQLRLAETLQEAMLRMAPLAAASLENRALLSAVLHLIAELYLGADADNDKVVYFADKISKLATACPNLNTEQHNFIKRLLNVENMKGHLG